MLDLFFDFRVIFLLDNFDDNTDREEGDDEAFTKRNCKRLDKNACPKCYDFPFISKVKDRVKRMDKIFNIEQYT